MYATISNVNEVYQSYITPIILHMTLYISHILHCIVTITFQKYITPHYITSYKSHQSYHITSHHIISYHIISYHIISYHIIYHIISYIISYQAYHINHIIYHITSHHSISHHITSYHIISYIISYQAYHINHINHIIYHITSHHRISYHIISQHIISQNTISYCIVSLLYLPENSCLLLSGKAHRQCPVMRLQQFLD